jgi:hypothetical protein
VSKDSLEARKLNTSWIPEIDHPSIPLEMRGPALSEAIMADSLRSFLSGAWTVTDEWNKLLPHLRLTKAEDFLRDVWEGKQ